MVSTTAVLRLRRTDRPFGGGVPEYTAVACFADKEENGSDGPDRHERQDARLFRRGSRRHTASPAHDPLREQVHSPRTSTAQSTRLSPTSRRKTTPPISITACDNQIHRSAASTPPTTRRPSTGRGAPLFDKEHVLWRPASSARSTTAAAARSPNTSPASGGYRRCRRAASLDARTDGDRLQDRHPDDAPASEAFYRAK